MSEFVKTWNESFKKYAVDIAKIYAIHPEQILNCLGFDSVVGSLNETYQSLVKQNELKPIEELDSKTKNELWSKAKEYSDKKEKCIMICRAIYLLNTLTQ